MAQRRAAEALARAARGARYAGWSLYLTSLPLLGLGLLDFRAGCCGLLVAGLVGVLPARVFQALATLSEALRVFSLPPARRSDWGQAVLTDLAHEQGWLTGLYAGIGIPAGLLALLGAGLALYARVQGYTFAAGLVTLTAVLLAMQLVPLSARALEAASRACSALRAALSLRPGAEVDGEPIRRRVSRSFDLLAGGLVLVGLLGTAAVLMWTFPLLDNVGPISALAVELPWLGCALATTLAAGWLCRESGAALGALLLAASDREAARSGRFRYRPPFRSDRLLTAGRLASLLLFSTALTGLALLAFPLVWGVGVRGPGGLAMLCGASFGAIVLGFVPWQLGRWAGFFSAGLAAFYRRLEEEVEGLERVGVGEREESG